MQHLPKLSNIYFSLVRRVHPVLLLFLFIYIIATGVGRTKADSPPSDNLGQAYKNLNSNLNLNLNNDRHGSNLRDSSSSGDVLFETIDSRIPPRRSTRTARTSRSLKSSFGNLFSSLKQSSRQALSLLSGLTASIPFTKIFLSGGAILGLLLIFLRMLIVMGPILILGAMTRESTDATDFLKMIIEFYNQVIIALDEQQRQPSQ